MRSLVGGHCARRRECFGLKTGLRCQPPGLGGRRKDLVIPLLLFRYATEKAAIARSNLSLAHAEIGLVTEWPHHREEACRYPTVRSAPGLACRRSQPFAPVRLGGHCRGCGRAQSASSTPSRSKVAATAGFTRASRRVSPDSSASRAISRHLGRTLRVDEVDALAVEHDPRRACWMCG